MSGAREHAMGGIIPGGTEANFRYLENTVRWASGIARTVKVLLCDAQTSGGLLASVDSDKAEEIARKMQDESGMCASVIGRVIGKGTGRISVF
jgi:selenide,water dikinase